ncbi:hypothetical protein [Roseinatronobacter thiooxidans]|uniref:hypothetical protein n=1 Tax=Roseinatronobacter thiooxidans TaxID=121821 RepID=UPI001B881F2B|nr:hypothetical protein [Roseinatronobacter thiooxidans]
MKIQRQLRLTLATMPADLVTELDAAIEALGLIAFRGKVVNPRSQKAFHHRICLHSP